MLGSRQWLETWKYAVLQSVGVSNAKLENDPNSQPLPSKIDLPNRCESVIIIRIIFSCLKDDSWDILCWVAEDAMNDFLIFQDIFASKALTGNLCNVMVQKDFILLPCRSGSDITTKFKCVRIPPAHSIQALHIKNNEKRVKYIVMQTCACNGYV